MVRTAGTGVVLALALICGRSAAAQTRGALQATATLIDARVAESALAAVNAIVLTNFSAAPAPTRPISDRIANIRVERRDQAERRVVVTIDYSRN